MKHKLASKYYDPRATKLFNGIQVQRSEPSASDLDFINAKFALEPLAADALYTRTIQLANDQYDRDFERFPAYYLEKFAETIPGKGLQPNHNTMTFSLGKFFGASVEKRGETLWLDCKFYMPKTPGNQELRDHIDAGVVSFASIGFYWAGITCDLCKGDLTDFNICPHMPGQEYGGKLCRATFSGPAERVEAVEGSLCYLGAQYGAGVMKDFQPSPTPAAEMTLDEQFQLTSEKSEAALAALEDLNVRLEGLKDAREEDGRTISKLRLPQIEAQIKQSTAIRDSILARAKKPNEQERMLALRMNALRSNTELLELGLPTF